MKKLLFAFLFIVFISNSSAQTYKVQRMNGVKMYKLTYSFYKTIKKHNRQTKPFLFQSGFLEL